MIKLFYLAIVMVAHGASSALAQEALQKVGCVVNNGSMAQLDGFDGSTKVWNNNNTQYLEYTIQTNDDPAAVFSTVTSYMAQGVGNAASTYQGNGTHVFITYSSLYDSTLPCPAKILSFVRVVGKFSSPFLGGNTCTQYCSESATGCASVLIKIPLNGGTCDARCTQVFDYLRNNNYVDDQLIRYCDCSTDPTNAQLQLNSIGC